MQFINSIIIHRKNDSWNNDEERHFCFLDKENKEMFAYCCGLPELDYSKRGQGHISYWNVPDMRLYTDIFLEE